MTITNGYMHTFEVNVFFYSSQTNSTGGSNLVTNSNHSNGNRAGEKDVKIMTLKRKQKMLKAELEQSLTQRVGFQEAFQEELDLRTKIEERLDNLRARYEVCVIMRNYEGPSKTSTDTYLLAPTYDTF